MAINSLRDVVEQIKARGKAIAEATGTSAASARDLVYLSKSVESIFGADALLELIDDSAKPAVVKSTDATSAAFTLDVDDVTKQVVEFKLDAGATHAHAKFTATFPNKGFAMVIKNSLDVPLEMKTSTQVSGPTVAAGETAWIFCEGTEVEHVIDVTALSSALTNPTTSTGDMIWRDGPPAESAFTYYVQKHANASGSPIFAILIDKDKGYERTPDIQLWPGKTYAFDVGNSSNTGLILRFSETQDGTHNATPGTEYTTGVTRTGTPGVLGSKVEIAVTSSTPSTLYIYEHATAGYMGSTAVLTVGGTDGIVRLPIGGDSTQLTAYEGKPEWRQAQAVGRSIRSLANHVWGSRPLDYEITDAATFPHAANKGVYSYSNNHNTAGYRGWAAIDCNGRGFIVGSSSTGRNGDDADRVRCDINPLSNGVGGYVSSDAYKIDSQVKGLFTAYHNSFAVLDNGTVLATGFGTHGQQGDGGSASRSYWHEVLFPADAGPVRYIVGTSQGPNTTSAWLALMEDGDVYSWGYNAHGALGLGDTTNRAIPTKVTTFDKNVRAVTAGGGNNGMVAFITNTHQLYTCGYNAQGSCGNGTTDNVTTPALISVGPATGGEIVKVCINGYAGTHESGTSCNVLRADGKVYGMGHNNRGNLGDNSTTNRNTPVLVANLDASSDKTTVINIFKMGGAAAGNCTYATAKDGTFWAWGSNNRGQLGDGSTTNRTAPVEITGPKWVSMAFGPNVNDHSTYFYNASWILAHDSEEDMRNHRGGTVYSAGYSQTALGHQNRPTNQTQWQPMSAPPMVQGRITQAISIGHSAGATVECAIGLLTEDGDTWTVGYGGAYARGDWDTTDVDNVSRTHIV
jgi:alpha-tubulin suppressor-like RCC1 family protein